MNADSNFDTEAFLARFVYDKDSGYFFRKLSNGSVSLKPAGTLECGYRIICFAYKDYTAHSLVWRIETGQWPQQMLDHINGNRDDNRFVNLRDVSNADNSQNRRRPNRNRVVDLPLGVYPRGSRYEARFTCHGVVHRVGVFDSAEVAYEKCVETKRLFSSGNTL